MFLVFVLLLTSCGGNQGKATTSAASGNNLVGNIVTSCGTIGTPGTYILQNDVSSPGTCFTVTAAGVTLDLNGHTVTYDNEAPVIIPNGSFESDLSGTWDTSNAPDAARMAGTYVAPVTVYDGSYALRFSLPANDQYVQTMGTVTLDPNTTYSLSAMFYNPPYSLVINPDGITMTVTLVEAGISATMTGTTWRGFQYTNAVFTTGSTAPTYHVRVSIAGAATSTGSVYVDDIKILKAGSHGVYVGPGYTNANNLTVTNGVIVQGQGKGFNSAALSFFENSGTNQNINNLNITTTGINSRPIEFTNGTYGFVNSQIAYNTLNHNGITIKSRDQLDGAVIYAKPSYGTIISHNKITNGPQGGIVVSQTLNRAANDISFNSIALQSKYTNAFAIGSGGLVHDNTINCGSGTYSCRGIYAAGSGAQIYNNTIAVQLLPNNQEYGTSLSNGGQAGGCSLGGAYGIQSEDDVNAYVTDLQVYGNTVTAYSNQCEAYALRTDLLQASSSNNKFYNNMFTAIATGSVRASAFKNSGGADTRESVYNNTFVSNRRWIYILTEDGEKTGPLTLTGNAWQTTGSVDSPFSPFETSGIGGTFNFVSNAYGSSADKSAFEPGCFVTTGSVAGCSASVSFTLVP
jgi:hypothetical protein